MKRLNWLLCAMLALVVAAGPVLAGGDGDEDARPKKQKREKKVKREKRPKSAVVGQYAKVASVAGFSDEQKTQLAERIKAYNAAAKSWREENKEKLNDLRKQMTEARKAKDKEAMTRLRKEYAEAVAGQKRLHEELWKDIHGMMTDEQKNAWVKHQFYQMAMRPYARLKLSDEQKEQIQTLAAASAGDYQGADRKGKGKIATELKKKIEAEVLTDEQRDQIRAKRADRGQKDRKPKRQKTPKGKKKQKAPHEDDLE